ncbi:MAG: hypothetical protein H7Y17_13665, partial [Chlorobia bacterium]|nr:hypothetical protein [Fimbriimonadaceae bacterium]
MARTLGFLRYPNLRESATRCAMLIQFENSRPHSREIRAMLRSIALLSVLVCSTGYVGAEEHKLIAMSEWSKPVESHDRFLQARWILQEGRSRAYAGPGKEILLYVELQNANGAWGE